ncbi:MAG: hypothetical protein LAT58_09920, partial [Opitutales bacterium]|nr:hypothetical protein [Opitutales bacterium]
FKYYTLHSPILKKSPHLSKWNYLIIYNRQEIKRLGDLYKVGAMKKTFLLIFAAAWFWGCGTEQSAKEQARTQLNRMFPNASDSFLAVACRQSG